MEYNVLNISKAVCIFLIIVHLICGLILCPVLRLLSSGWIKTLLFSVISSYGYFFYTPRFIYLFRTSFTPCLQSKNRNANTCEWTNLHVCLRLSRNYRRPASLLEKKRLLQSFFCCSSNNSQSFFPFFFIFSYIVLFSFCAQIFLFTRCKVGENENYRQGLQSKWLVALKQLLELDLAEASKTNPYVLEFAWMKTLAWTSYWK